MLKYSENNKNIGTTYVGVPYTFTVQVFNNGVTTLPVSINRKSCRCVTPSLDRTSIGPGEMAGLTIVFTPEKKGFNQRFVEVNEVRFNFNSNVL